MTQLTALDAQFLNIESATTAAHVAGVAILDATGGAVTRQALARLVTQRMHLSPALSQRLVEAPLGLDRPYWTEDTSFDVDQHVFETTLPAPGDDERLAEEVARLHARRLDRSRPLWEMHLIKGLTGGRVAVYTKVHHAAIDGVSGAETLAALLDLSPEPRAVEPAERPRATPPSPAEMLARAAARTVKHPFRALRSLARTAAELDAVPLVSALPGAGLVAQAVRQAAGGRRRVPPLPPLAAPRTPFNGPISGERQVAFGSVQLKDVKRVGRAFGLTVNDVVMALCASALRAWLRELAALPDRPLVAAVPVAVRTAGALERAGNQISAMVVPLATDVPGGVERLRAVKRAMDTAKRRFALAPAGWPVEASELLPPPLAALAMPALFRLASLGPAPVNLIVSNVPGPQFPLYLCGGRVLAYYPLSVVSDATGGLAITCLSYDGMLDFGLVACPRRVPDVWRLMDHLHAAMAGFLALEETAGDEFRDGVGVDPVAG
ncbi:WS/DGAT/MGAT family O-acyltransferase [Thermoactinospora rubra]|uniref:WS/DGAT/MGAT family O-acyltransferase n=1 Tax=Thermoactinospora rubra TaxID=1088767 RepID=UPI000A106080|nr:wax ester/triacylglycerol synthase family O-acyltransferase [Thermoactinospora rubra]